MSRYRLELATEADDEDLRRVLADTPMDGRIQVAFHREPSYFGGASVDGRFHQTIACRDTESGRIIGFGSRSITERYINGVPEPIGYLSALRVLEQHRNRGLVARGYAYFRKLHTADNRTTLYLTTIAEGNEAALAVLTSGRAGLPAYHEAGWFYTVAIPIRRRQQARPLHFQGTIRPAAASDAVVILDFLTQHGPARQFFPCYTAADIFSAHGLLRSLRPENVLLAYVGDRLTGILGGWDQQTFRQSVVHGYSGSLRYSRTLYNAWAWARGLPPLPSVGKPFRYLMGALPIVADHCAVVFHALLDELLRRAAGMAYQYLLVGLHESDPLLRELQSYGGAEYKTRLFLVCWEDGEPLRKSLDGRPPYLELGCL
ncbi:MAG: hypothetical protein WD894_07020 [Pirellulales bacterium]